MFPSLTRVGQWRNPFDEALQRNPTEFSFPHLSINIQLAPPRQVLEPRVNNAGDGGGEKSERRTSYGKGRRREGIFHFFLSCLLLWENTPGGFPYFPALRVTESCRSLFPLLFSIFSIELQIKTAGICCVSFLLKIESWRAILAKWTSSSIDFSTCWYFKLLYRNNRFLLF